MATITTLKPSHGSPSMRPQTIFLPDTTARSFILDKDQAYTFVNEGKQSDGTTASTAVIRIAFDGAAPNVSDLSSDETDQVPINPGSFKTVGPGEGLVHVAATAEVLLSIVPTQRYGRAW